MTAIRKVIPDLVSFHMVHKISALEGCYSSLVWLADCLVVHFCRMVTLSRLLCGTGVHWVARPAAHHCHEPAYLDRSMSQMLSLDNCCKDTQTLSLRAVQSTSSWDCWMVFQKVESDLTRVNQQ